MIEIDGTIGNQMNEATANQQVEEVKSAGYDLAKPQIRAKEVSKEYDHLKHLGLNKRHRPNDGLGTNDMYAHAQAEGDNNNETYSHVQSGQYFQTYSCTPGQNGQCDDTYEHAKNVGYGHSDTYDHFHLSVKEAKNEFADYDYAHAQNSALDEGDYDHAGFIDGNDRDTFK